ncbi:MAG: hypothetical protein MUF58_02465 [Arcicella sp.]|nr:hypothetical protein [Arcicella sp.]
MMEAFQQIVLWIHIIAGGIALIIGLVPMVSEKGSMLHIQSGKIYYWAMFLVFISALLRFRPEMKLIFLECIAIFSFYNTFTGRRLVQMKLGMNPQLIDWIALYTAFLFATIMAGISVWGFINHNTFLWVTLGFFSMFCFRLVLTDWQIFNKQVLPENMHWMLNHIARMTGSYIATLTAFIVVNNKGYLPELVAWLSPAVIGTLGIIRWRSYYRSKFSQKIL